MKTEVSIPDPIFAAAEQLATKLGISVRGRVLRDPQIESVSLRLAEFLGLRGPVRLGHLVVTLLGVLNLRDQGRMLGIGFLRPATLVADCLGGLAAGVA